MDLLERSAELVELIGRWRRARDGAGGVALVGGETGVGKTALVRAFVDEVGDELPVLWGACDPLSTPRPLGPLHDVADDLGTEAASLLAAGAYSHEVFAGVFDDLRRRAAVLVVDDLHWADEGTIDLLRFVLRRIGDTRSFVVATYRHDEIGADHPLRALLGDVARSPAATAITLRPLTLEAVTALIGDRPLDPARLHRLTGGNPFFVGEILAQEGDDLPATVVDAVLARTAGLSPDARDVLDLLACAPETIADRLLPALGIGIEPLRALAAAGLIERRRRGVAFRHDLCRLAIADALPPGGEVALHRRMIEALESLEPVDPAVLTHHALAAGDAGRVLRYGSLAGVAASRAGAHAQAAAFFQAALDHGLPGTPAEQAGLLELLGAELYLTNRLGEAIAACTRAVALREEAGDTTALGADHEALSIYHWYNADREVAERHASTAVAVLQPATDLRELGHAYATEAYLAMQNSDLPRAERFLERARAVAAEVDDHRLDLRLRITEAVTALSRGDLAGRDRLLATLAARAEHFDEICSSGYSNLVYLDVEQRRLGPAADVLDVSLPLTVERDIPICNVWQLGVRGRLQLLRGDWQAAVDDAREVLDREGMPLARTWPHLVCGLVGLRRGDATAAHHLDEAWALATRFGEPLRLLPAAAALAEAAWLAGGDDARLDGIDVLLTPGDTGEAVAWSVGDLAVWLHRLGRPLDAGALDVPDVHRLLLEGDPLAAAARWEALGCPYDRALALAEAGDGAAARLAVDLLDRLGADAVADRVRRALRAAGVAAVPARRRRSTLTNPAGLTDRQLDVLRLLADGMTDAELAERLFISPKTAGHHVSAILAKLGVASRREAAAAARRLGVLDAAR